MNLLISFKGSQTVTFSFFFVFEGFVFFGGSFSLFNVANQIVLNRMSFLGPLPLPLSRV